MQNNEINIQDLWHNLFRYKWTILFVTLLFTSAVAMYAYILTPLYSTSTLVAIDQKSSPLQKLLPGAGALESSSSLDTNIRILKSRKIISKVVENIDITKHFYKLVVFHGFVLKKIAVYRPPFAVKIKTLDDTPFHHTFTIDQIDTGRYLLSVDGKEHKQEMKFGVEYKTKHFIIAIFKRHDFTGEKYQFTVNTDKLSLTQDIINNLTIRKLSDNLLQISYQDPLPQRTKKIVDEIAHIYIQYNLENKTLENKKTLEFLDQRLKFIRQTLKNYGNKLKKFQEENSLVGSSEGSSTLFISKLNAAQEKEKNIEVTTEALMKIINKPKLDNADIVAISAAGIDMQQINAWM